MSFADIINQEKKKLDEQQGGNNARVEYPETKHKRLFYEKGQREILVQVLPSADLVSAFAEPVRKIFLQAKSSQGKDINTNFTLAPDSDQGSLLENKITEWADKGMIPNGFGGQQSPRRVYLVNVVNIIQNQGGQYVQELDEKGELVVRVFEMPQSAYSNLLRKLQDPLYNTSGSELSFMDVNRPAPIKISRPAKGQMEYPVDVYNSVALPPLNQGWENQLEDLLAHAVPTERLVNGDQWVQAFIDMKEGRKPNQNNNQQGQGQSQNPSAGQQQTNPYMEQGLQGAPNTNAGEMVGGNPYAQNNQQGMAPNTPQGQQGYGQGQGQPQGMPQMPQGQQGYVAPQTHQYQQAPPQMPNNNGGIGTETRLEDYNQAPPQQPQMGATPDPNIQGGAPQQPQMGATPQQPQMPETPQQPQQQTQHQQQSGPATHQAPTNNNGLTDIDAMLEAELNGGN